MDVDPTDSDETARLDESERLVVRHCRHFGERSPQRKDLASVSQVAARQLVEEEGVPQTSSASSGDTRRSFLRHRWSTHTEVSTGIIAGFGRGESGRTALTDVPELYRVPVRAMAIHATYTRARAELARLCDAAAKDNEVIIITRRGAEDVALVSAAELRSLRETAHLLRSPRNAERLLAALARARTRRGRPQSLRSLRREVGLDEAEG